MATYEKTGWGRLDDGGTRDITEVKAGFGSAGTTGAGVKRPVAKAGFGSAGTTGAGFRSGRVLVKTGLQTNWWPEPPFMEDWVGVRAVGSGVKVFVPASGVVIRSGVGKAGASGYGRRSQTFTKTGRGVAGLVGSGRPSRAKIGHAVAGAVASGWKQVVRAGNAKYGAGAAGLTGSGFQIARPVTGRLLVRVAAYDETSVAGVSLLVDGVQYGEEVTANLENKAANGRVETDASSWWPWAAGVVSRTTSSPKYGTGCIQVVAGSTYDGVVNVAAPPWVAGHYYRVGVWVKGTAGEWVEFDVARWYDWSTIGGDTTTGVLLNGSWQFVQFDALPTSTEAHCVLAYSKTGAQTFYLDALSVVRHAEFVVDTAEMLNGIYTLSAIIRDSGGHSVLGALSLDVNVVNQPTPEPRLLIEIAMDSDPGDEVQIWTDVTADFVEGSWGHGRSRVLERMEAGDLSVRLANHSRWYDAVNPESPYYGKFKVGKRIRTSAVYNDAVYPRFMGSISAIRPVWVEGGKGAYVDLSAVDDFGPMAGSPVSTNPATLLVSMTGANNDIVLTSLYGGGEDVTLTLVNPGTTTADEVVVMTTTVMWARTPKVLDGTYDEAYLYAGVDPTLEIVSRDIVVTLAYSGGITTTAQQLVDAINESDAGFVVYADLAPGNSGAGVVTAMAKASLSGGALPVETTGQRINWVLNRLGFPTSRREIDDGTVSVQAVELDRVSSLDHLRLVEASELGEFFFDGSGKAVFHDQNRRTDATLKHTYVDAPNTSVGEHLYLDAEPEQGIEILYNDIEVSAAGLTSARAFDRASADSYWASAFDHQTLLTTEVELEDRALLLLGRFKTPFDNMKRMVLDPRREAVAYESTTAWPHALGLEVSDRLHVRRSPPGGGELLYETFVESVADRVEAGSRRTWLVEVGMSVAFLSGSSAIGGGGGGGGISPGAPWVLGDATYGILGSTTRLA